MNINEKNDIKTENKNSELKIIIKEDKKEKKSLFIVMIIKVLELM